jgi:hypothetical protein
MTDIRQVGYELFWRPAPTLGVHEECRVDQESHDGRSSRDSPARMSRKSLENSSSKSTGEHPRRRARHSETARLETGGGAMRQTARPRRRMRNREPASTRSRTSENDLLASVAESH